MVEGSTSELGASIVVPTKDRVERLVRLLEALDRQEGPAFEVIVVDDGSTDGTTDRVNALASNLSFPCRIVGGAASGPAAARNRGWRAATAPVVLFTDDDCVPAPKWVAALVEILDRERAGIATGVTTFPEDQAKLQGTWAYWVDDDGQRGFFPMSNVAYTKAALEAVDGLDESYQYRRGSHGQRTARAMYGEDTDLAWRAIEAGFRNVFAPEAIVYHDVFPQTWLQHLRNMRRLEGTVLLFKRHPQLRARLGARWTLRTEQPAALGALIGILGLSSRRLRPLLVPGALGAAWYLWIYARYKDMPVDGQRSRVVPLAMVADAYASLVMLRASIRYHTLLV